MTADAHAPGALEEWRERSEIASAACRPTRRTALTAHALAWTFVALAVGLAATVRGLDLAHAGELAALLALYVLAYRFEFEAAAGSMVPTAPVLVAMLVLGPLELVPLLVLAGILLGGIGEQGGAKGAYGWAVRVLPAWHSLGPAAVLVAAGVRDPRWDDWPVLVLALAAQFVLDGATASARMASLGVDVRTLRAPLWWTFRVDALMAVIGAALVIGSHDAPGWVRVGLVAVPVVLVRMLGRDRSRQVAAAQTLGAAYETVITEAAQDPLTGLANRRGWEQALEDAVRAREDEPELQVVVLAADLDGLKSVNDASGHEAGDALLRTFAGVLSDATPGGVAARVGGDEFVALLTGATAAEGERLVGALRAAIAAQPPVHGARLSASLGWAAWPPAASLEDAVRAADDAAGRDKRLRRAERRTDPPRGVLAG